MARVRFSGQGVTIENAFEAALQAAMTDWKPRGPDDMVSVHLEAVDALYGGIVGFTGTRMVEVSREEATAAGGGTRMAVAGSAAGASKLVFKLEVVPDIVYANLMPPVRHPQPHSVGLVLTVANIGDGDYKGQSPDGAVARFTILRGRTVIYKAPENALDVITPIAISAGHSVSFTATWHMDDAVKFIAADLHAVARFVPTGAIAVHDIVVRPVF